MSIAHTDPASKIPLNVEAEGYAMSLAWTAENRSARRSILICD